MAKNLVTLSIDKIGGNAVTAYNQVFDAAKIDNIRAVGDGVGFIYDNKDGKGPQDFETGTMTLTQFNNAFNTSAPSGGFDVVLVYDPSANTGDRTITAHDLLDTNGQVFYLPDNTRVWDGYYEVVTTFTSATDAGTISFGIPTDDVAGIKAATAISTGTTYDAGAPVAIIQVGTIAAISEKTTAARTVQATVAIEALTAGKLYLYLKCVTVPT